MEIDPKQRVRKEGDFNTTFKSHHTSSISWKPSIRQIPQKETQSYDEGQKRQLKSTQFEKCYQRDPILEGDPKSIYSQKRVVNIGTASETTQKLANKKYWLPSEQDSAQKQQNKENQSKRNQTTHDFSDEPKAAEKITHFGKKIFDNKYGQNALKDVMAYHYDYNFKIPDVSRKCTEYATEERQSDYGQGNLQDYRKKRHYPEGQDLYK